MVLKRKSKIEERRNVEMVAETNLYSSDNFGSNMSGTENSCLGKIYNPVGSREEVRESESRNFYRYPKSIKDYRDRR